ncbi:MAG: hypothetical protein Q9203_006990 [Teloschistes exilis]
MQALSQGNIQTMLADAGLLEPEHEYVDDEDKEDEKQQVSAKGQSEGGDSEPYPYEVEYAASEVSIEELHRKTISEKVPEKYREFIEQEQAFESRHQEYAAKRTLLQERIIAGDISMTPTVFDGLYSGHTRNLTRSLAVAEQAYDEALARRRKLGPADWNQISGYIVADEYDGYPLNHEDDMIQTAPLGRIRKWLADMVVVDEVQDIMDLAQGAENEFGSEDPEDPEEVEGCLVGGHLRLLQLA